METSEQATQVSKCFFSILLAISSAQREDHLQCAFVIADLPQIWSPVWRWQTLHLQGYGSHVRTSNSSQQKQFQGSVGHSVPSERTASSVLSLFQKSPNLEPFLAAADSEPANIHMQTVIAGMLEHGV